MTYMDDTRRNDRLRQDYRRKRRKRRKKQCSPESYFLIAAITVMCYFGIRIIVPFFSNDLGTSTELQTNSANSHSETGESESENNVFIRKSTSIWNIYIVQYATLVELDLEMLLRSITARIKFILLL